MTLAGLLVAALVVCSLPAFAQDLQAQGSQPSTLRIEVRSGTGFISQGSMMMENFLGPRQAATSAEPWRIIPNRPADLGFGQIPPYESGPPEVEYVRYFGNEAYAPFRGPICNQSLQAAANCQTVFYFMVGPTCRGLCPWPARPVCYAILGYLAARDSKDPDSMHPAGYTTCQEASRYQSKAKETRSNTPR